MSCKQKIIRYPNANEQVMKEDALKTMRNARIEMLMRFPFLGELAMQLDITPILDERLPIACTDGKIIYVNASSSTEILGTKRICLLIRLKVSFGLIFGIFKQCSS